MIDITNLTSLITAFRNETEQGSISPETLGSLLQAIAEKLKSAQNVDELTMLKDTVQQLISSVSQIASTQTKKQDKLVAGVGITINDDVISTDFSLFQLVNSLPDFGEKNKIYIMLVFNPDGEEPENALNKFVEYIDVDGCGNWEMLGEFVPTINLNNYTTKETVAKSLGGASSGLVYIGNAKTNHAYIYDLDNGTFVKTYNYDSPLVIDDKFEPRNAMPYLFRHPEKDNSTIVKLIALDTSTSFSFVRLFYGCKYLEEICDLDSSHSSIFTYCFYNCSKLKALPNFDMANAVYLNYMLYNCKSLRSIYPMNLQSAQYCNNMFYGCESLTEIFLENTENVVNMGSMFSGCKSLVTLSEIDASSVTSTSKSANYALNNMFDGCSNLVNFGGLRNAKVSFNIANCIRLSHESLMNVINNLALVTNAPTLTLGAENSAKLTEDELQIARNKGWNIALY